MDLKNVRVSKGFKVQILDMGELRKIIGGAGFSSLGGVEVGWGALSLVPFFWALPPSLNSFATGVCSC